MVRVPMMFIQPQLSARLSSDLVSQEPETRNMESPMSVMESLCGPGLDIWDFPGHTHSSQPFPE